MKKIYIIYKKEILEILRDQGTLMAMVLMPLLIFPMLFFVAGKIQTYQLQKNQQQEQQQVIRVGFASDGKDSGLLRYLSENKEFDLKKLSSDDEVMKSVQSNSVDVGVVLDGNFGSDIDSLKSGNVTLLFSSFKKDFKSKIEKSIVEFEDSILTSRLQALNITQANVDPLVINEQNIIVKEENVAQVNKMLARSIPLVFVIFCFVGCMYSAIDLFSGEKERGTIETLLTLPVNRAYILFGKLFAVVTVGLTSCILAISGLGISVLLFNTIPKELLTLILNVLEFKFIVILLLMLIPVTVFFAGIIVPVTVGAKSSKEAGTILGGLSFAVFIPAILGIMPGMELNFYTALIPISNISLATKQIIEGNIDIGLVSIVILSLLIYALISVLISAKQFGREESLTRV